ncbi:N-acyl-phosphatidylethanolamine-hydrolyzing phospholipase D isoform X3 [Thraustotheca clavata]|uniref:N-acyl-phosphatidylethanolamine-hydrolyzing phospholipase D isoform X3 n=1 Tax=Thraustotheca clavata TaxID=74557 RepID=A0A1V9ZQT3_9STRA|nr:N-acyl-phosphatidylethanolamine-hydrolyzing phospholipase D isoform X3 [Thraustotheca clavata]
MGVRWMKTCRHKHPVRWFSRVIPEDLLPAKRNATGSFENPKHWDYKATSFARVLKWRLTTKDPGPQVPKDPKQLDAVLSVLKPDFTPSIPIDQARITWLGHASVLLEIPVDTNGNKVTILTDPVFSDRCSPLQWAGPKRYRPSPLQVKDLPNINAVVLSHNHYDHLDNITISQLSARFPTLQWFVPLDNSQYITPLGVSSDNITEQNWWDSTTISLQDKSFTFSLVPVMHWSRRDFHDTNKALWGGWVVQGLSGSFFFCGDTAYCSSFKAIGHRFGRQSISAIPIGGYGPKEIFGKQHCDVHEAVQIHHDVDSAASIAIHWGTWVLTGEYYLEPKQLLEELAPSSFSCINHGASKLVAWNLDKAASS